jgi:hypothetical protein
MAVIFLLGVGVAVDLIEGFGDEHEGDAEEGCHHEPLLDDVLRGVAYFAPHGHSAAAVVLSGEGSTVLPMRRGMLIMVVMMEGAIPGSGHAFSHLNTIRKSM